MPLVNLRTILLYDRRHVRPDTIREIREAEDGDVLLVDKTVLDAFTPLHFFEPVGKGTKFKQILLCSSRGFRPDVIKMLLAAKHMDMLAVDPGVLDAFTTITLLQSSIPEVDVAGRVKKKKKRSKK